MPLLFQRVIGSENRPYHRPSAIRKLLIDALAATGLTDADGEPLHLHAARLPQDLRHRRDHQRAAAAHRPDHLPGTATSTPPWATRPSTPTKPSRRTARSSPAAGRPTQRGIPHPDRRGMGRVPRPLREAASVALGTCGRAFGTPLHPRARLRRCPLLRPDPAQRPRLEEIRDNLNDRITEAERDGWRGEAEGLQVSLAGVDDKLTQIDTSLSRSVNLGTPTLPTH